MRVRKVDSNGDMTFGQSRANFWRDVPDGVAQVVASRLHLELGEWFLDTADGTPWNTQVLGKRTESTRDPVIRARILSTDGVLKISNYDSVLDRETRAFSVNTEFDTRYGRAVLSEPL